MVNAPLSSLSLRRISRGVGAPRRRLTAATGLVAAACVSSAVDPRCAIDAPDEYVATLAQSVNGSKLWQTYFEQVAPSPDGARWSRSACSWTGGCARATLETFSAFTPILEEQAADAWSEQLAGEAKAALKTIHGS